MKIFILILSFLLLTHCSFNEDSKFWTEQNHNQEAFNLKLKEILNKSDNIFSMTFNEYMIYLDEYNKNSKYPDINK